MDKLGFVLLMIGCAGMDGQYITIPTIMVLAGLLIIGVSALKEKSFTHHRPK